MKRTCGLRKGAGHAPSHRDDKRKACFFRTGQTIYGRLSFSVALSFGDFQFVQVCGVGFRFETVEVSDVGEVDIARLRLSEEDMEKVRAWRSTSDRNVLQLWEIYDDILTLRIRLEEPIKALREYTIPHPSYRNPDDCTIQMFFLNSKLYQITIYKIFISSINLEGVKQSSGSFPF